MVNLNCEQNTNNNQNGTYKSNSISETPIKVNVCFEFTGSLTSHTGSLGCACAHIFQKRTSGALIGAGALYRANTVVCIYGRALTI